MLAAFGGFAMARSIRPGGDPPEPPVRGLAGRAGPGGAAGGSAREWSG
jgi:hypothetical protein